MIFCSNEDWALKIEKGDGRIFPLELDDSKAGDLAYFDKLSANFNEDTALHLYNYFLRVDLSKFKAQNIPKTKLKTDLIFSSASPFDKFLIDCRDGYVSEINDQDIKQTNQFGEIFKSWCQNKRIKNNDTDKQFAIKLGKVGLKEKRKEGKRCLLWDMNLIKQYVEKICPDNSADLEEFPLDKPKIPDHSIDNEFEEI